MDDSPGKYGGELCLEVTSIEGERLLGLYLRSQGAVTGPVRLVWVCAHEDGTEFLCDPEWFNGAGEGVLFRT